MTRLRVLAVHGIANGKDARRQLAPRWQDFLRTAHVDAEVTAAPWSSYGDPARDVWGLVLDGTFRAATLDIFEDSFNRWHDSLLPDDAGIVFGHSAGCAIAATVLKRLSVDTPLLAFGSPYGNRVFDLGLRSIAGFLDSPLPYAVDIWNPDDRVTKSFLGSHRVPSGWQSVQLDVATAPITKLDPVFEHAERFYLTHPVVHELVAAVIARRTATAVGTIVAQAALRGIATRIVSGGWT